MTNKHIAKNPANQPLVDAYTYVLENGPSHASCGSCHNAQWLMDGKEYIGGIKAYRASVLCAKSLGSRFANFPVEGMLEEYSGISFENWLGQPLWQGYPGAMRRQWMSMVREYVKNLDGEIYP